MSCEYVKVSWTDVIEAFQDVAHQLKDNHFDCIVCIGRGGMIPARLMSEYLNIRDIHFIPTRYVGDGDNKKVTIRDEHYDFSHMEEKSILVVDEIYTTGKSISAIYNYIFDNANEVKITNCVGWLNEKSPRKPDVWSKLYNGETQWIVFPWEYTLTGEINEN